MKVPPTSDLFPPEYHFLIIYKWVNENLMMYIKQITLASYSTCHLLFCSS